MGFCCGETDCIPLLFKQIPVRVHSSKLYVVFTHETKWICSGHAAGSTYNILAEMIAGER